MGGIMRVRGLLLCVVLALTLAACKNISQEVIFLNPRGDVSIIFPGAVTRTELPASAGVFPQVIFAHTPDEGVQWFKIRQTDYGTFSQQGALQTLRSSYENPPEAVAPPTIVEIGFFGFPGVEVNMRHLGEDGVTEYRSVIRAYAIGSYGYDFTYSRFAESFDVKSSEDFFKSFNVAGAKEAIAAATATAAAATP